MTSVQLPTSAVKRSVSPEMFDDLCDVAAGFTIVGAALVVTFDADLDEATTARVRDRLLTADATQEQARATIRELLEPGCCDLCVATARYVLGD